MSSELAQLWEGAGGQIPPDADVVPFESLLAGPKAIAVGVMYPGEHADDGVPLIKVGDIKGGRIPAEPEFKVSQAVNTEYQRTQLRGDELLITLVGEPGACVVATPAMKGWNPARAIAVARLKDPSLRTYVKAVLESRPGKHLIDSVLNTTVQKTLNLKDIRQLPVPLPARCVVDAVSQVVDALDDRITLLRETNATLEAIAQALFKSWFVDFDPVRAKRDGRAPEGMDEATAALFPDSFEDSELGEVPRGWSYCSLKEVTRIFDSIRVPLSGAEREKRRGEYPYYGAAALMDHVDDYLFDGVYLLTGEDGSVADVDGLPITQYVWGKFWVNNHAHVLRGANGVSTEHLMLALKQTNIRPYITGAVQAKLSQSNMWRIQFMRSTPEVAAAFSDCIAPLFASFRHNADQAQTLSTLRDTLLPRLISGQLRLPELETVAEAA